MNTKQLFFYGASMLAATLGGGAIAQQTEGQYILHFASFRFARQVPAPANRWSG